MESTPTADDEYRLRGHRVPSITSKMIGQIAQSTCNFFGFKKSSFSRRNIGQTIQKLEEVSIYIDPVDEREWIPGAAEALVDTGRRMIYMPERLYQELELAKPRAIKVFLHELGHVLLLHKQSMQFNDTMPIETEDSEWQADTFADSVIALLDLPQTDRQLELRLF